MIGVAYPLDLTLAANLTMDNNITRNAVAVQQAILSFTGTLLSQGYSRTRSRGYTALRVKDPGGC